MSKLANEFINELICLFVNEIVLHCKDFLINDDNQNLKPITYNLLIVQ
jgi:hypothetical protein